MLRESCLLGIKPEAKLGYALRPVAQCVENPDPQRICQDLEEFGLEVVWHRGRIGSFGHGFIPLAEERGLIARTGSALRALLDVLVIIA
jgi:hypothetical protein